MTVLLDALSLLLRDTDTSCPDLVIAGGTGGQAYDLDAQVAKRGLGQHVRCLGPVPNEKKNALLRSATAFVFPSLYEGFGIPPLEAMAFGAPVIAAKSTSLPEVLDDAAIYSEPGDQVSLAEAISRVLGDAELRKELADKGKRRAAESDWTSGAKMLVNSFEKLVDSK
jgi:alpha-1,3-rhamnosyl/mannosyltransferase